MNWLNYHHLYYFWVVAREGSITRATKELRLAQPTISGQLRELERQVGEPLFKRQGRQLVLTDMGKLVYQYAGEIFALGRDLQQVLRGHSLQQLQFHVGITQAVPKLIAHELLRPALSIEKPLRIHCREDRQDRLVAALAIHELDVVLSDTPLTPGVKVRAYNHLLGEWRSVYLRGAGAVQKIPVALPALTGRRTSARAIGARSAAAVFRAVVAGARKWNRRLSASLTTAHS